MALLSELVSVFADRGVDSLPTLTLFARRLREAGRLTQAGRGRGAAHMTFMDAARFAIACLATDHPERAADAEIFFSNLAFSNSRALGGSTVSHSPGETFESGFASLLRQAAHGQLNQPLSAIVERGTPIARIRAGDIEASFAFTPAIDAPTWGAADNLHGDLAAHEAWAVDAYAPAQRFRTAKNLVAIFEDDLIRALAKLVAGENAA